MRTTRQRELVFLLVVPMLLDDEAASGAIRPIALFLGRAANQFANQRLYDNTKPRIFGNHF